MDQILNNEWGIYKIDFPNGKSYIGQSSNLKRRINDYKNWEKKCFNQTALYNAFKKFGGFAATTLTILYKSGGTLDKQKLNDLEINYIKNNNTMVPNGYNIQPGGNANSGYKKFLSLDKIKIQFDGNWEEPILDVESGKIYDNVVDWLNINKFSIDEYYNLYFKENYKFRFLNYDKMKWDLGNGTVPKDATIKDVLEGVATAYVSC